MKLVCIDFDGTLTRPKLIAKIKSIIAINSDREDIKIGILTARSIFDDFKTPGQFADDIETLLIENDIRLDFISTTYAHYKLDRNIPPANAIANAEVLPVFGEVASDYLLYRRENRDRVVAINLDYEQAWRDYEQGIAHFTSYKTKQNYIGLDDASSNMRDKEVGIYNDHVSPKRVKPKNHKFSSVKPAQIEAVAANYGNIDEVLLIDDAKLHVDAVTEFKASWSAELISESPEDLDRVFKAIDIITENLHSLSSPGPRQEDSETQDSDDELDSLDSLQEISIPEMPTKDNQIAKLIKEGKVTSEQVEEWKNNTHPIADPKVAVLAKNFLTYKKKHGTEIEKKLYQNMSQDEFITRLLTKRPLAFLTSRDQAKLRNGKMCYGGFENIGTNNESKPLILADYISYDEMQISALLGVSSPTYFINKGDRGNRGKATDEAHHETYGIYVGHVGARFEKQGLMEWQHMMVTPEQNKPENGYGDPKADGFKANTKLDIWKDFYGVNYFPSFSEIKGNPDRYINCGQNRFIDIKIYKERMRVVIESYLEEANQQGARHNKKAYVHAVGLGTGVWAKNGTAQEKIILDLYKEIIKNNTFNNISDVDFSWFNWKNKNLIASSNIKGIQLHFSKRNPADKLKGIHAEKLLVADYAWDGNSFPGNEYWMGDLDASGDPAAACCSLIPQLQSVNNIRNISGKNLRQLKAKASIESEVSFFKRNPILVSYVVGVAAISLLTAGLIALSVFVPPVGITIAATLSAVAGNFGVVLAVNATAAAIGGAVTGGLALALWSIAAGITGLIRRVRGEVSAPTSIPKKTPDKLESLTTGKMQKLLSKSLVSREVAEKAKGILEKKLKLKFNVISDDDENYTLESERYRAGGPYESYDETMSEKISRVFKSDLDAHYETIGNGGMGTTLKKVAIPTHVLPQIVSNDFSKLNSEQKQRAKENNERKLKMKREKELRRQENIAKTKPIAEQALKILSAKLPQKGEDAWYIKERQDGVCYISKAARVLEIGDMVNDSELTKVKDNVSNSICNLLNVNDVVAEATVSRRGASGRGYISCDLPFDQLEKIVASCHIKSPKF